MGRLDGRVIIVTGGTQGVGEAVALHAASEGAAGVVICGRQEEKGRAVCDRIEQSGGRGVFVRCDLSSEQDCRLVVRTCDDQFGRVDGLVNAAADTRRGSLDDTTVEFWDHQFAVNVRAPFLLCQEAVRIMRREQIEGTIVNVLSVAKYCGMDILMSYSATKGALSTLTKNLANALRFERIRVNGINLGWTDTPAEHQVQHDQGSSSDWLAVAEQAAPFGRLMKPDDVARLAMYLLSDDSGILTGSTIDFCQRVVGYVAPETGRPTPQS